MAPMAPGPLALGPAWSSYRPLTFSSPEGWLRRVAPSARVEARADSSPARRAVEAYLAGALDALAALEVELWGTAFQVEVWRALREVPAGATTTYGRLAAALGRPKAVRAVGAANGANPVALVCPCHRVIGEGGELTGYAGGLDRKRWLLEHEGARPRQPSLL